MKMTSWQLIDALNTLLPVLNYLKQKQLWAELLASRPDQVIFRLSLTAGDASVRTIQPGGQRVLLHAVSC